MYASRFLTKLASPPWPVKVASVFAAMDVVLHDAFFAAWIVLVVANTADWLAGRLAARALGVFKGKRSREGLVSKGIALTVVALLRSAEAVVARVVPHEMSTDGLIAVAITLLLIYEDIESLDRHRQTLGSPPIPLLSWGLKKLRQMTGGDRRKEDVGPPDGMKERRGRGRGGHLIKGHD